jgi:CubicO group peptidase (beta-lactamase class C family)
MLLQARSGIYHEAAAESQWMKDTRPERGSHAPGAFHYYNNWDFNALGTIFTQYTGKGVFEALEERVAQPLEMQDFDLANCFYQFEPVSEHPAYHFAMSARDMARFGLLFLRNGRWRDQQIVPTAWIEQSTSPYSEANSLWDYGYMWWLAKTGTFGSHTVWQAAGGGGHAIWVVPDMELVVVHRVDYATWRSSWDGAYEVLRRVLYAKGG